MPSDLQPLLGAIDGYQAQLEQKKLQDLQAVQGMYQLQQQQKQQAEHEAALAQQDALNRQLLEKNRLAIEAAKRKPKKEKLQIERKARAARARGKLRHSMLSKLGLQADFTDEELGNMDASEFKTYVSTFKVKKPHVSSWMYDENSGTYVGIGDDGSVVSHLPKGLSPRAPKAKRPTVKAIDARSTKAETALTQSYVQDHADELGIPSNDVPFFGVSDNDVNAAIASKTAELAVRAKTIQQMAAAQGVQVPYEEALQAAAHDQTSYNPADVKQQAYQDAVAQKRAAAAQLAAQLRAQQNVQ